MDSPHSKLLMLAWLCFGAVPLWAQPDDSNVRRIVVSNIKPKNPTEFVVEYGLTRDDLARIEALEGIRHCTPIRELRQDVWAGEHRLDALVVGATPGYAELHSVSLEQGRFLTEKDLRRLNNVAVLNDRAARGLFPEQNPVGQNVRIGQDYYLVVGVEAPPRESPDHNRPDPQIFLPLSTMRSRMGDVTFVLQAGAQSAERFELSRIELEAPSDQADETIHAIGRLLARQHPPGSFRVETRTNEAGLESAAPAKREDKP